MGAIRARIMVSEDGSITGVAPGLAPGEHEATILIDDGPAEPRVRPEALASVHAIQRRLASLPVRDDRPAEDLLGYDERGLFA